MGNPPYGHRNQDMDGMAYCCLLDSLHRLGVVDHDDVASKALEERNHEVGSVLHGRDTFREGSRLVAVHNQRNAETSGVQCCWNDARFSAVVAAMAAVAVLGHLLSSVDWGKLLSLLAVCPSSVYYLLFLLACCC